MARVNFATPHDKKCTEERGDATPAVQGSHTMMCRAPRAGLVHEEETAEKMPNATSGVGRESTLQDACVAPHDSPRNCSLLLPPETPEMKAGDKASPEGAVSSDGLWIRRDVFEQARVSIQGGPMVHFLPSVPYDRGLTLEGMAGELEPLPIPALRAALERYTPLNISLVFLSAGHSEEAGRAFLDAGGAPPSGSTVCLA